MWRKQAVNVSSVGWCLSFTPVSSGWCYGYDTVLMHRHNQGKNLYMYVEFGVDGELYDEVRGTWCFVAKSLNGWHHHGQLVWRRIKLFITFNLQDQTMILTDCEVCCVKSVGGCRYSTRIGNISKWRQKSKWTTWYWCVDVFCNIWQICRKKRLAEMGMAQFSECMDIRFFYVCQSICEL